MSPLSERKREIMRKSEKERQRRGKRGQCFAERLAVVHQSVSSMVSSITLPPVIFLLKFCFFDQANITEEKTGTQT